MSSIKDFKNSAKAISKTYSAVRPSIPTIPNTYKQFSAASSAAKKMLQDSSVITAQKEVSSKPLAMQILSRSGPYANLLKSSDIAAKQVGRWVSENQKFFSASNPVEIQNPKKITDLPIHRPTSETNKRLDQLNESSEKTTELLQLMVNAIQTSNETNLHVASILQDLATKQEESNTLSKSHHKENAKSAEESTALAKASLKSSNIAAWAGIWAIIVAIALWAIDRYDILVTLITLLSDLLIPSAT